METLEMEKEAGKIADSNCYQDLVAYVAENKSAPEKFRSHWWLARLAFAMTLRKVKQKLRNFKTAEEKRFFYRTLRRRLPAFVKGFAIF